MPKKEETFRIIITYPLNPPDKEKEMGTVKCHTAVRSGIEDFPGGPGVKNLLAEAEHGFDPQSGKIPHAERQ